MVTIRPLVSIRPAAVLAAVLAVGAVTTVFAPSVAMADGTSRVASIAAKGQIPAVVPVEAGLGLGLCAGLLAIGMDRRSRRTQK
jgi:hypothetical protein